MTDEDQPLLTIGAVARLTGIPAATIRAWERRYGIPRPSRTASGRRLYRAADLALLRQLRTRQTSAAALAAAWRETHAAPAPDASLLAALRHARVAAAEQRLDELVGLLSTEAFLEQVLWPLASALEQLSPAAAWLAVQLVRRRLLALLAALTVPGEAPLVVAGLGRSDLRVLALGLQLARRGVPVLALGLGVPLAILPELLRTLPARALVVEGGEAPTLAALAQLPCPLLAVATSAPAPVPVLPDQLAAATDQLLAWLA